MAGEHQWLTAKQSSCLLPGTGPHGGDDQAVSLRDTLQKGRTSSKLPTGDVNGRVAQPARLPLRTKWLIFRARFSTPALLASHDEAKVTSVVTALNGGATVLVLGTFAWLMDLPLIFPALGPTAFLLFSAPLSSAASPRSVVLGHLTALAAGFAVWNLVTWVSGDRVSPGVGGWPVVASASAALALTCFLLIRLSLGHPPACASSLVVSLGAVTNLADVLLIGLAVVILTWVAVIINRIFAGPVPWWRDPIDTAFTPPVRP